MIVGTDFKNLSPGLAFAIAGAALFALRPVLVKLIYAYQVDPVTVMLWRMLFALPCFVAILIYLERTSPLAETDWRTIGYACLVGFCGYYFAALFDLFGLQTVSAQLSRMILYTYPTIVTLLGWWLLGLAVHRLTWLALVLSYIGIGFIFLHDRALYGSDVSAGSLWVFASAVCFSLYLLLSKSLITKLGSIRFTCIAMIAASALISVHYLAMTLAGSETVAGFTLPVPEALGLIFVMSIASTVIPAFLTSAAIQRIGASATSVAGMFGPGMTAVFAVLILGERFTVYHLIGMALVIGGIAFSAKGNKAAPKT